MISSSALGFEGVIVALITEGAELPMVTFIPLGMAEPSSVPSCGTTSHVQISPFAVLSEDRALPLWPVSKKSEPLHRNHFTTVSKLSESPSE